MPPATTMLDGDEASPLQKSLLQQGYATMSLVAGAGGASQSLLYND